MLHHDILDRVTALAYISSVMQRGDSARVSRKVFLTKNELGSEFDLLERDKDWWLLYRYSTSELTAKARLDRLPPFLG